jgi:hypothetical protein
MYGPAVRSKKIRRAGGEMGPLRAFLWEHLGRVAIHGVMPAGSKTQGGLWNR